MYDIHYLLAINVSPTKYDTIQEILSQVKAKVDALHLTCSGLALVLDHVIYSKALKVLQNSNNTDLKEFVNLRMDGFHVWKFFGSYW